MLIASPRACEIRLHFVPTMIGPPSVFDHPRRRYGYSCETPPNTGSMVWKLDYEWNDAEWMKHTLYYSEGNRLEYKPVNLKPLTVESIPPKVRSF